jgi:hypothetical protein
MDWKSRPLEKSYQLLILARGTYEQTFLRSRRILGI